MSMRVGRYRVDVLEAILDGLDSFYVNGTQFRPRAAPRRPIAVGP